MSHTIRNYCKTAFVLFLHFPQGNCSDISLFVLHEISFQPKNSDNKWGPPEPQKVILKGKKDKKSRSPNIKILINIGWNQLKPDKSISKKPSIYSPLLLYPITASNLTLIFRFKTARKRSGSILKERYINIIRKLISSAFLRYLLLKCLCLSCIMSMFIWNKVKILTHSHYYMFFPSKSIFFS